METKFKLILTNKDFKWDYSPAYWSSVFINSNDDIPYFDDLIKVLNKFNGKLQVLSVIGGFGVFKLLQNILFTKVIFLIGI